MCLLVLFHVFFFFFKQKTAYEMRISDWSSDVCSSDLFGELGEIDAAGEADGFSGQALHLPAAGRGGEPRLHADRGRGRAREEDRRGLRGGRGGRLRLDPTRRLLHRLPDRLQGDAYARHDGGYPEGRLSGILSANMLPPVD